MKKHEWVTHNRIKFESLHKTFNRQVNCISTGNVIANTQYSSYIRPYHELECNGFTNPPGHLQDFDLNGFVKYIPYGIREEVKELTHDNGGILYHFHHWNGGYNGKRIDDGIVLTTRSYEDPRVIKVWYVNQDYRAISAVDEVIKYIAN